MGVVNRTLDPSEQKLEYTYEAQVTATGTTCLVALVPFNANIIKVATAVTGLSLAPTAAFSIHRFIAGTGLTLITGGITTITLTAYGTSGIQSPALAPAGSSLLAVLAGDMIVCNIGGSTAAVNGLNISVVIQGLQDIKTHFGA